MASNYPQPNRNHFWTVGILVAVIAGLCGVIALLLLRGGSEAQKEKEASPVAATREDAYLNELRADIDALREEMPTYLISVPDYVKGIYALENGKLLYGNAQDEPYVINADGTGARPSAEEAFDSIRLAQFEADEDALVGKILKLIETPEVAELLSGDSYFGTSFQPDHPDAILWLRYPSGHYFTVNQNHKLIELNACEKVIDAAQEYVDSYEGEGSPWD